MTITVTAKVVDPELAAKFHGVEVRISVVERPTEDAIGYLEPDEARTLAADILAAAQAIDAARLGASEVVACLSAELIQHSVGAGSPRCEAMVDASFMLDAQQTEIETLKNALVGLTGIVGGLHYRKDEIRDVIGNTNWEVLEHWVKQADAAISKAKGAA